MSTDHDRGIMLRAPVAVPLIALEVVWFAFVIAGLFIWGVFFAVFAVLICLPVSLLSKELARERQLIGAGLFLKLFQWLLAMLPVRAYCLWVDRPVPPIVSSAAE